jgi:5-deoxy-glucuronate isomerase
MIIKNKNGFKQGYNSITEMDTEDQDIMMDFGILKLSSGSEYSDTSNKEKAILLIYGEVELEWDDQKAVIKRGSFVDDDPWTLNVSGNTSVKITGISQDSELAIMKTENEKQFESKLYTDKDCRIEIRGKGFMNEAGTRIVKTIMDVSVTTDSNFMLGEDVQYPGKWAGFPSHHHEQPEIYYYKLHPENGFGLLKLGDEALLIEHNDTVKILPNLDHPQVAAPGYAMYFLWVIRHLKGNPYVKPTFEKEHLWVEEPNAVLWPDK